MLLQTAGYPLFFAHASALMNYEEKRYTIILENCGNVILEKGSIEQVQAFWDTFGHLYYGIRLDEQEPNHSLIIVTDDLTMEEELTEIPPYSGPNAESARTVGWWNGCYTAVDLRLVI